MKITFVHLIYYLSRFLFLASLVITVFLIVFSLLSFLEGNFGINIPFVELLTTAGEQTDVRINIPLTEMYVGYQYSFVVVGVWLSFSFYAFYFHALSQFFKVFTEIQVFTEDSLKKLKRFGWLNLIPVLLAILLTTGNLLLGASFQMDSEYLLVAVHLLVALLTYFYLQLISKGKKVQEENDLTI